MTINHFLAAEGIDFLERCTKYVVMLGLVKSMQYADQEGMLTLT